MTPQRFIPGDVVGRTTTPEPGAGGDTTSSDGPAAGGGTDGGCPRASAGVSGIGAGGNADSSVLTVRIMVTFLLQGQFPAQPMLPRLPKLATAATPHIECRIMRMIDLPASGTRAKARLALATTLIDQTPNSTTRREMRVAFRRSPRKSDFALFARCRSLRSAKHCGPQRQGHERIVPNFDNFPPCKDSQDGLFDTN